jgi:hypothetical protein
MVATCLQYALRFVKSAHARRDPSAIRKSPPPTLRTVNHATTRIDVSTMNERERSCGAAPSWCSTTPATSSG